jgi:23S rRNA-/tRNA-specific pseudouridylate synthase
VVGDATYGGGRENSIRDVGLKRAVQSLGRHFLHSSELAFNHPRSGERFEFTAPLPAELAAFLAAIG